MVESIQSSDRIVSSAVLERPIRVLHVDDDPAFLKVAKQCLEMQGEFEVDTASSVNEALEKLKKTDYDAVVSDYQMPGKDGLEFLKELREKGNTVPFIVFTGRGREEIAVKALNLGADGYFNKQGQPETVYGELAHGMRHVVDKRRAEQSFLKSEDKYRRLVETLHEGIWAIDKDSRTTFVNPRMAEILGYDTEEMKGRHLFSFMDERGVEIAKRLLERRKQNIKEQHDFEFLRKDGKRVYATLETTPITDDNGNYSGALASVMDTTERKKAEEELKSSEQKFRCLVEESATYVGIIDLKGQFNYVNKALADSLGYSVQELTGRPFKDFLHPDDRGKIMRLFLKSILLRRKLQSLEFRVIRKDGHVLRWMAKPTRFAIEGKTVGFQAIITDVTERKKAEVELRNTKNYLDNLLNYANAPIIVWDNVKRITLFNNAFEALTGHKRKSMLGRNIDILFPPLQMEEILQTIEGATKGEKWKSVEIPILCKDKETKITLWNSANIADEEGKTVATIAQGQDITERRKAEEALRQSVESYGELAESIGDMFFAMDKDFRYTYWNKASEKLTGISAKDAIGKSLTEVFPDVKGTGVEQFYKEALRTQQPQSYLNKYQLKGKDYVFELNAYPTKTGVSVFVKDVTERKKEEHALLESKQKLERLFESIPQATASVDVNDCVLDLNPRFSQLFGYSAAEAKGKPLDDLIVPNDKKKEAKMLTENSKEGYVLFETVRKTKDGSLVPVSISAAPISVEGQHVGDMVLYQDITGRKQTEEALRKSEEKFRNLFDSANDAIMYLDRHGRILDVNGRAIEIFGGKREELIGKHFTKIGIFSIKEIPMLMRNFANIFAGKRVNLNVSVKNKKGQEIALDCSASLMKTDEFAGIVVIARDISERLKAEEELRNSEARLKVLFELAPDAYYLNDLKGNFIDGNKAAEEVTGYTKNELIGKSFLKLKLLPRSQALKAAKLLAINAFGKPTGPDEFVLNRKDGTQVPVEIRTHPVKIKGKTLVLGIARDITTRKKDEQAILESQQKFAGLFRHNPEASVYLDLDFKVLDVNPRFCELFGYSAEEVEGKWINEVVTPEDMIEEAERLDKDAKKGYASLDTVRKRKDGSLVHVSISAAPLTIEGRPFGYVGVYKDIANLKEAEERLKEINKRLEAMNEKLYVVGGLTRHDVRNKLSAVTGNAYLLRRKLTEDPKALEQLKDMEAAVRLVEEIFEFARNYEKLGAEKLAYMDVGKAVEGAVSLFPDLKGVKIVNECEGLTVLADSLLRQLFYNLIDNSLKYGEKTRQIKIHYNTLNADQLEFVYEDDGVGIPDNMRSNLFKEGFTSGKGTGYGLFMIKRIIEVYGWNIQETGIQGKGVKFVITISKTNPSGKENYLLDRER